MKNVHDTLFYIFTSPNVQYNFITTTFYKKKIQFHVLYHHAAACNILYVNVRVFRELNKTTEKNYYKNWISY